MNKVFEKIIEKLEELHERYINQYGAVGGNPMAFSVKECIEIVKQEAEHYEECYKDCGDCEAYNKEKHHCPKFCKVITEAVNEIEENHNGWIPCSERLPENDCYCLVTTSDMEIDIREYGYSKGFGWDGFERIIAWKPLPLPYQPKGE